LDFDSKGLCGEGEEFRRDREQKRNTKRMRAQL
jgi:hypothetical protein